MRESWARSDDRVVEIEFASGSITWANDALLSKCPDDSGPVGSSVKKLVAGHFRERVQEVMDAAESGMVFKRTMWPVPANDGILWWTTEVVHVYEDKKSALFRCRIMSKTKESGDSYELAVTAADSVITAAAAVAAAEATETRFDKFIDKFKKERDKEKLEDRKNIMAAISAAERAAESALANKASMDALKDQVSVKFDEHMEEIMKLVSTDAVHDERLKVFDDQVKKTTALAMKSIVNTADLAGRGLSKKVTIPVGLVAAILTIVQWVMMHWPKK